MPNLSVGPALGPLTRTTH